MPPVSFAMCQQLRGTFCREAQRLPRLANQEGVDVD